MLGTEVPFEESTCGSDRVSGFASLELMRAWSAEDARRGQHLQLALADSDKNQDGVLSFEEFADVLTRVRLRAE